MMQNDQGVYNPHNKPQRKRMLNFDMFGTIKTDVNSAGNAQQDFLEIHKHRNLPNVPRSSRSGHYKFLAKPKILTQPVVNYHVPTSSVGNYQSPSVGNYQSPSVGNYQSSPTVYYNNPWLHKDKNQNINQQYYQSHQSNIHRPQYSDIRKTHNPDKYNNQNNNKLIMTPLNTRKVIVQKSNKKKIINTTPIRASISELEYKFHCEQYLKTNTPNQSHEILDKNSIFYSPMLHKKNNLTASEKKFAKTKVYEKAAQLLGYEVSTAERKNVEERSQYLQQAQTKKDNAIVNRHKFNIDFDNERSLESSMSYYSKDSQNDDEKKESDESFFSASLYDDDNKQDEEDFDFILSQIENMDFSDHTNNIAAR